MTALPSLRGSLEGSGLEGMLAGDTKGSDLLWEAEIYQWKEKCATPKCATKVPKKEWTHHPIDSSQFEDDEKYGTQNFGAFPSNLAPKGHVVAATGTVLVGDGYYLSQALRQQITQEASKLVFLLRPS